MNEQQAPSDEHEARTLTAELTRRLRGFLELPAILRDLCLSLDLGPADVVNHGYFGRP